MGITAAERKVRPTIVDGIFYPAERGKLRDIVEELLETSPTPQGNCFGIVSPHAGYSYAGHVMASAFRSIQKRSVKKAVLIGPVHRDPLEGVFLPESELFATPFGPLSVDMDSVEKLLASAPVFMKSDVPHLEEHCLEVQLPFIARLFPDASIVPLLIGKPGLKTIAAICKGLRLTSESADDYNVYIVSANMASYMKGTDTMRESETIMSLIESGDWRGIAAAAEKGGISSCGAAAIAALISLAGESARIERLAVADSRGVDGDPKRAVHYAAFSIAKEKTG
jgi:AmmeMemoRadiSam system protein B